MHCCTLPHSFRCMSAVVSFSEHCLPLLPTPSSPLAPSYVSFFVRFSEVLQELS